MKKFLSALCAVVGSVALAEGGSGTPIIPADKITQLNNNMTQLGTDLGSWATGFMPVILTIIGVFMLFWLLRFAIGMVKGFSKSSK